MKPVKTPSTVSFFFLFFSQNHCKYEAPTPQSTPKTATDYQSTVVSSPMAFNPHRDATLGEAEWYPQFFKTVLDFLTAFLMVLQHQKCSIPQGTGKCKDCHEASQAVLKAIPGYTFNKLSTHIILPDTVY